MLKMEMRPSNFTISIHLEKKIISSIILIETNNLMVFEKKKNNNFTHYKANKRALHSWLNHCLQIDPMAVGIAIATQPHCMCNNSKSKSYWHNNTKVSDTLSFDYWSGRYYVIAFLQVQQVVHVTAKLRSRQHDGNGFTITKTGW